MTYGADCTSPPDKEGYTHNVFSIKPLGILLIESISQSNIYIYYYSGASKTFTDIPKSDSCEYDGKTYNEGDSFDATDGCNTCTCSEGQIGCTKIGCNASTNEYIGDDKTSLNVNINDTIIL